MTAEELAKLLPTDAQEIPSDEPEMESSLHYQQLALLVSCLEYHWQDRNDFFIGANLTVYYHHEQLQRREFRGPDFFLVRNVVRRPRKSWVVWNESNRYPDLIIELLSDSTAKVDRTAKKDLYQDIFRTPEYFYFSPEDGEFAGFHLRDGRYQSIEPNEHGHRYSQILDLYLGMNDGELRYFTAQGLKIPSPAEAANTERQRAETEHQRAETARQRADTEQQRADTEQQRAETEHQRAETERQRAEALAAKLRALGVDPDAL